MSPLPSRKLLAVAASLIPTTWSAAVSLDSRATAGIGTTYVEGFPHPDPIKSYWQDPPHRIANLRTTPDLPTNQVFDYIIVGSGVSGAATAMKLLNRDPELSVLMLEGRTAASGATGRNGGHCKAGDWKQVMDWVELYGEDEALRIGKLEQDCTDDMADFVREYNVSSGWQHVETADLYFKKENYEAALEVLEFQRELAERRPNDVPQGNPRTAYSGQEARDHWGWPEILGAVAYRGYTQNPYLTVCAMLEVSLAKGLNLQTNTMARHLAKVDDDSQSWKVETDRGTVKGHKAVLATNSYTSALHSGFASTNFIEPARSQISAVHPSADTSQNPVFRRSHSYPDFPASGDYIIVRQPDDIGAGDVIYGGGSSLDPNGGRNITDDSVLNERIRDYLRDVGHVTFGHENWGDETEYVHDWVGITCYTPDGFPLVGPVPGEDGLYASVCMNGHGMAWAFRSAEALVQTMTEGEAPQWFPEAFRAARAWE